jgi:hypothetical protein
MIEEANGAGQFTSIILKPKVTLAPGANTEAAELKIANIINGLLGRGSWIRTNDLQYPKLPRYQAALYPDYLGNDVDTRLKRCQQGAATASMVAKERMPDAVSRLDAIFFRGARDHLEHPLRRPPRRNDLGG